ncbi:hypothetical protein [Paenibacillus sp. HJGM_3]|uniref:hypothetical protein n=1 Tax=Paenibacillus sp. HJGM_3 TaxID=3379816 RepID=UPI00385A8019
MAKNMRYTRMAAFGLLAATLVAAGGCTAKTRQVKSYSGDGYLGVTNGNPSLPISPTAHTYQSDTDMMKGALALVPGISRSRINLNGSRAKVKLYVPAGTSDEERERIRQGAVAELTKAMPRYVFHVTVR